MSDLVAVYGTLRHGGRLHHHLGVAAGRARLVGRAHIAGDLYEVVPERRDAPVTLTYPCFYEGVQGRVLVELYDVLDPELWHALDELEGYLPHDLAGSEYHRRLVPVLDVQLEATDSASAVEPAVEVAWTYVYVRTAPDPARRIVSGDWITARR